MEILERIAELDRRADAAAAATNQTMASFNNALEAAESDRRMMRQAIIAAVEQIDSNTRDRILAAIAQLQDATLKPLAVEMRMAFANQARTPPAAVAPLVSGRPAPLAWTPELVARFWNGMAQEGLDAPLAFGRFAKNSVYWVIRKHLEPKGRHLDYGSGGGEIARHLIENGYSFSTFEPSEERQARSDDLLQGIDGYLGRPGAPGEDFYDVVTCFEVIEHVLEADFERVCDEIAAFVRPGGKLIVTCPNNEDLGHSTVYCPLSNATFHRWQHVRSVPPQLMIDVWARRGIEKVALHLIDFSEQWYRPYLHMMGAAPERPLAEGEFVPKHVYEILNDIDSKIGGAQNLLFVGRKNAVDGRV